MVELTTMQLHRDQLTVNHRTEQFIPHSDVGQRARARAAARGLTYYE
jgi:hypothetical protein